VSITIRLARPEDVRRLEEIERASFADPSWDGAGFLRYPCMVAEIGGSVAGFLVARNIPPEHEILNVAVAPEYRRQGVATTLLRLQLQKEGTHFLEVRESNVAAQKLYRKLGFVEVGRRPKYYQLPTETAIVMRMK
jgi:[ribosomal protein S18]-alanine N-acetyltransferase